MLFLDDRVTFLTCSSRVVCLAFFLWIFSAWLLLSIISLLPIFSSYKDVSCLKFGEAFGEAVATWRNGFSVEEEAEID